MEIPDIATLFDDFHGRLNRQSTQTIPLAGCLFGRLVCRPLLREIDHL
jgi:hypothetical protein